MNSGRLARRGVINFGEIRLDRRIDIRDIAAIDASKSDRMASMVGTPILALDIDLLREE